MTEALSKIFQFCINLVFSSLHSSLCSSVHRFVTAFSLHHSLKYAVVTPALKKSTLDPSDANNYHPISNLTFISKLLERIVLNQLNVCLQQFNLLPGFAVSL